METAKHGHEQMEGGGAEDCYTVICTHTTQTCILEHCPTLHLSKEKGVVSQQLTSPSAISSASASPVAGARSTPQQPCPGRQGEVSCGGGGRGRE